MQVRSFANGYEINDWTQELSLVPNTWGLVNSLGLFQGEGITTSTVLLESREGTLGLLQDPLHNLCKSVTLYLLTHHELLE